MFCGSSVDFPPPQLLLSNPPDPTASWVLDFILSPHSFPTEVDQKLPQESSFRTFSGVLNPFGSFPEIAPQTNGGFLLVSRLNQPKQGFQLKKRPPPFLGVLHVGGTFFPGVGLVP